MLLLGSELVLRKQGTRPEIRKTISLWNTDGSSNSSLLFLTQVSLTCKMYALPSLYKVFNFVQFVLSLQWSLFIALRRPLYRYT
jgi:hypothetical protein